MGDNVKTVGHILSKAYVPAHNTDLTLYDHIICVKHATSQGSWHNLYTRLISYVDLIPQVS